MPQFDQRRDRLRQLLRSHGAEAMLVTNFTNVTYLTGFTGDDSYLLVTRKIDFLITDGRYTIQANQECPGLDLEVRQPGVAMIESVSKLVKKSKAVTLGLEANSMTVSLRDRLADALPRVILTPTTGLVEQLRMIKDRHEVAATRHAIQIAERAFGVVRAALRAEQTEKQVADQIDHQIRLFGGNGCSFPSIVAVGPKAALPHATPGESRIGEDHFVLIDWGAKANLYTSDLTRLLVTGKISPKFQKLYEVVLKAQRRAINAIRPGVTLAAVDKVARSFIARAGYGKYFRHGLGHGIGLEIHEAPRLAPGQDQLLRKGMIVTVEPGIYLPGWGGIRIEDDILITQSGHEVLTNAGKDLADSIAIC